MKNNNSIQEEFISTVSHELRTPLTSIRGFSQTLLNSWDKISDDDKKRFLKIIEEQSNRLINLVENILSVSKKNIEKQVLKQVDINQSIKKTTQMLAAQYKDFQFNLNLSNINPKALLDEDKFQQIITNLMDNAAKYSTDKKIVEVNTRTIADDIIIEIKDYGVGIKKEDFHKLFQKFTRLDNHLTSKTQGNGLGLFITKQLIENLNGQITFESEENKGTTFRIQFPIYNQEEAIKCSQTS